MVTKKGGLVPAVEISIDEAIRRVDHMDEFVPLNEREFIDRALDFATAEGPLALHAFADSLRYGRSSRLLAGCEWLFETRLQEMLHSQSQFVALLECIRAGQKAPKEAIAKASMDVNGHLVIRPTFTWTPEVGTETHYRYEPATLDAALGFVAMMLLDRARPFVGSLCRCKLEGCGKYFLAVRPTVGRPRRGYCSRNHMDEQRGRDAAKRVQRFRTRQKLAKERARRGRRPK